MKRITIQLYVSLVATIISFSCYLAPLPSLFLSSSQMNEVLLSIFGAGISIVFTGLIEYCFKCNELENRLLIQSERVISSIAGLKPCVIESIDGLSIDELVQLLSNYFDEEYRNVHFSTLLPIRHDTRDKLIRIIENCPQTKCEQYANDSRSSFSRYISRVIVSVHSSVESYRFCFDKRYDVKTPLSEIMEDITYLPIRAFWRGKPIRLTCCVKKNLLKKINESLEATYAHLEKTAGFCRLYKEGDVALSELLKSLIEGEKHWNTSETIEIDGISYCIGNTPAYELFGLVSNFASYTSSKEKSHYSGIPWWAISVRKKMDCLK